MNKFKKLATLCMALVFSVGLTAFAACGTDTSSSKESSSVSSLASSVETNSSSASSEATSSSSDAGSSDTVAPVDGAYVFVVKHADGRAAAGVGIQLCVDDGCLPVFPETNENGVAVFKVSDYSLSDGPATARAYTIHVVELDEFGNPAWTEDYSEMLEYEIDGSDITPAEYGVIYITLK